MKQKDVMELVDDINLQVMALQASPEEGSVAMAILIRRQGENQGWTFDETIEKIKQHPAWNAPLPWKKP